ncbi:MAG: glycoside hydrolase family 130 protein [Actinomycetota bacterium]
MRVAFVSTYPPRRCGIATFTADLVSAVHEADDKVRSDVAAIDEQLIVRAYGPEVRWRISQDTPEGYAGAAHAIAASNVDAVCVQHEFGLYGVWRDEGWEGDRWIEGAYEDHLTAFLEEVRKPTLVTFHTVLPEPTPAVRKAVRNIAAAADGLVVMAESAVRILTGAYGVTKPVTVIQHGMPHIEPHGRGHLKDKLGLDGRQIVSTFGLVSPGKGLEYVIEAMPTVVARHPEALYLIAGQTHPELLRRYGETYRNKLIEIVEDLGLHDNVAFVNQYLPQEDVIELLLASDIYVTPYLDPNQITSGTLSYALGAGKAVVSTPYLHAKEALAEDRGILVDFRAPEQLADAINVLLDDPGLKARLERNAYAYANEFTWPKTGIRMLQTLEDLTASLPAVRPARPRPGAAMGVPIAARLAANPLITPEDVAPSQPGMEVISTINAGIARVGQEIVALLRVAERPRLTGEFPEGAMLLELDGAEPRLAPLPPDLDRDDLVGVPFFDPSSGEPRVVLSYVPRDLPGVDLRDPRSIRYRDPDDGTLGPDEGYMDYLTHVSHLRVARSPDGMRFEVEPTPAVQAATRMEEYGVEDPRVTEIEGEFLITYVSVGRLGITTSLLRTADFRTFQRQGTILLPDQKDVVLFPERVDGKYLALTRPMPASFGRVLGIWLAESPDLVHWGCHRPVALPRPGQWDEKRIGAGLVPIRVERGWLELYHGVDRTNRYGMGALLLDGEDPSKVLARTPDPLLVPEVDYERTGFLHDVVFPSGHVMVDDSRIRVYYGAADSFLAAADFSIGDVLAQLRPC